jgi:tetratricopeptide (TPR) repeat protein
MTFSLVSKLKSIQVERQLQLAANLFVEQGEYAEALSILNKILRAHPEHAHALTMKADIQYCLRNDVEALTTLELALSAHPKHGDAYLSKAIILEGMGEYQAALRACHTALKYVAQGQPEWLVCALEQKMNLLLKLGRISEAQRLLERSQAHLSPQLTAYLSGLFQPEFYANRRALKSRVSDASAPSAAKNRAGLRLLTPQTC